MNDLEKRNINPFRGNFLFIVCCYFYVLVRFKKRDIISKGGFCRIWRFRFGLGFGYRFLLGVKRSLNGLEHLIMSKNIFFNFIGFYFIYFFNLI